MATTPTTSSSAIVANLIRVRAACAHESGASRFPVFLDGERMARALRSALVSRIEEAPDFVSSYAGTLDAVAGGRLGPSEIAHALAPNATSYRLHARVRVP